MILNFVGGMTANRDQIIAGANIISEEISSRLHHSTPDKGPLANDDEWMPDMMRLFAEGIRDNAHLVTDQLDSSFDLGADVVQGSSLVKSTTINGASTPKTSENISVNVTIEPIPGFGAEMFRVVKKEARKQYESTGINAVVYGG